MATADDILAAELCDNILTVDLDNRVIIIPNSVTCIGVESDDNVEVLHFRCPRMYCDVDLSEFTIRINYVNAKGYGDIYEVADTVVGDDLITFDWVVGRDTVMYKGDVAFNLCLRDIDENGEVVREFNTTVATLPVLQGLETDESDIPEYYEGVEPRKYTLSYTGNTSAKSMYTADDILGDGMCDNVLNVDLNRRIIVIPKSVTCIGVESDDDVEVLHFRCPRMYCDVDLSEFAIRVNYVNAKGYGYEYEVSDTVVSDDLITFDWIVGREAVAYKGNVAFNLCLRDIDDNGEVVREFNTTVAVLPVLAGLEIDESDIPEYYDRGEPIQYTVFNAWDMSRQSVSIVDDILADGPCDNVINVDLDSRTIIIPKSVACIGVESDDNVEVLHFRCPRMYCGIDLSEFDIRINYLNAKRSGDIYNVKDAVVSDDLITFDWVVGRNAVSYKGNVVFNLCLKDVDENGEVVREFNTTVATLPVLPGLETGEIIIQEYADVLEQWRSDLFGAGDTAEQKIKDAENEALTNLSESIGIYIDENSHKFTGPRGYTFTPSVDNAGNLTWTNNGGLANPATKNIMGPRGEAFTYDMFTDDQLAALTGPQGDSIESFTRTSGTGAPGTKDTYTIRTTAGKTYTFQVYNGVDGSGSGDMSKSVYDTQNKNTDIFKYVDGKITTVNNSLSSKGDMSKSVYDTQNKNTDIFKYVDGKITTVNNSLSSKGDMKQSVYDTQNKNTDIFKYVDGEITTVNDTISQVDSKITTINNSLSSKGDMKKSVYDTQNKNTDIFTYVDDKIDDVNNSLSSKGDMKKSVYDTQNKNTDIFKYVDGKITTVNNSLSSKGDMSKSVYDTQNKNTDIFKYVDGKITTVNNSLSSKGDMSKSVYDTQNKNTDIFKYVDEKAKKFIGENPTGGTEIDTPDFWVEKGPGYYWISERNQVNNQPTQYGFIINYVSNGDVFQIFRDQNEGITYFRSGDQINAWFQSWTMVYDRANLTPDEIGAISKCVFWDSGDVLDLLGTSSCRYSFSSNVTGMPLPDSGYWWFVDTIAGDNSEDIFVIAVTISDDPKMFIRGALNGTWGGWHQIPTANDNGELIVDGNVKGDYVIGEWLQTTADTHRENAADKYAVLDGSGWIYHRTPAEVLSDIGASAYGHHHSAAAINGGTFGGQVIANSDAQAPDTSLLRNSKIVSTETNPTNNGEICWIYE